MANIFPRSSNFLPLKVIACGAVTVPLVIAAVWYYFTPKYTRVGYMPTQPVPFSHALHVGQLGMDCRYCHSFVEVGGPANIPTTQTCMNCHSQVKKDSSKLAAVRESWETGKPIPWVKIHQAPDYVYFNHSVHVNRGVSCQSCHGNINRMEVVYHAEPHSMGWCLECHRNPEKHIRPVEHVFNLDWKPEMIGEKQETLGKRLAADWNIQPPQNCAACHR
jgi:hypothetical protein